jgi:hypothetical protein
MEKQRMEKQLCMGQQRMGELSKLRLEQQLEQHMDSSMIVSKLMERHCKRQQLCYKRLEQRCRRLEQRYMQLGLYYKQLEQQRVVSKLMELSEQQHLMNMRRQLVLVHIQLKRKRRQRKERSVEFRKFVIEIFSSKSLNLQV